MYASIMHEWFDKVWNQGDEATIYRLLAPNAVIHNFDQAGGDARGSAGFVERLHKFRSAFQDLHFTVHDAFEHQGHTAARWTFTGTHTGDGLGFPATHRTIELAGMSFCHLKDGIAVEVWDSWDAAGMMRQLGHSESAKAMGAA